MNTEEIKNLWFECYGEDLKTDYSGFYKKLKQLEQKRKLTKKTEETNNET
tara:strand:- start:395 stop:544 length:150 start_codon:yes stop_codon:yes gene_type:complete